MTGKGRLFTGSFRAKVALAAFKGDKTLASRRKSLTGEHSRVKLPLMQQVNHVALAEELSNWSALIVLELFQGDVEVAVVLDRIAVGVEQRRVPIAERPVACFAVAREANVTAGDIELCVAAGQDDKRILGAVAVMRLAAVGEVEDHRVVEHRAVAFRDVLQARDDRIDQRHVVLLGAGADLVGSESAEHLTVADVVHVDLLSLKAGDAGVMMPEFVDRERRDVRQSGDQRRQ